MFTSTTRNGGLPAARRPAGLLLLVWAGVLAAGCVQVQAADGGFVMGGTIHIDEDDVAREDVVAVGGEVVIDGRARRDVVVIGGRLTINGEVDRSVSCIGGTLVLGPGARIGGDAVVVGGRLNRHDSARIDGELINVSFGYGVDNLFGGSFNPFWGRGWWGFTPFAWVARTTQLFYWLLLALLTVALVGDRVSSASHAIAREPLRLGAIGLVGIFALCFGFVVLLVLSFLIIGIPFLIALIFVWWLAYIFGLVAVFQAVGNRLMNLVGRPEASQIAIVLAGALVLGILRYVPFGFGDLLWIVAALVGMGSVFATRFGTGRAWIQRPVASSPMPGGAPVGGAPMGGTPHPPQDPAPPAAAPGVDEVRFEPEPQGPDAASEPQDDDS